VTGRTSECSKTVDLVRRVSSAGRGDVSPGAFLERVCRSVAEALELDRVTAARYHDEAAEVSVVAVVGGPPPGRTKRRRIRDVPLLVRARETEGLVLASAGTGTGATSAFAVPLIGGRRCLAFLYGKRRGTIAPDGTDADALATVGVVAATLFEHVLARQELQTRDVLKSEFIALAVHELRNPLSSIYGIAVTLDNRGDTLPDAERQTLRATLREQTMRMRNLVEQLLDLSRFDLAGISVSPEPLRLRPKIEELVRPLADGRPKAVTVTVPEELEVVLDPLALDRMLSNLVANALRHGKPPVTITAAGRDRHLRLAVEDRGDGVRREFVPLLFDRFTRNPEVGGQSDGSGLGLAIAQAYARAHGGDIVYERAVPHGARFEVVLPLRRYGEEGSAKNLRQSPPN
jgi:signal transduction histidine kinase